MRSFPKSTSPNCRAELTLSDGSSAKRRISLSRSLRVLLSSTAYSASASESIRTPAVSISASTGDHRLLDLEVKPSESELFDLRPQHLFQTQRHVGILGGVFGHPLQRNHVHSQLPGSLADERSDRNRPVIRGSASPAHPCCDATRDRAGNGGSSYRKAGRESRPPGERAPSGRT